MFTEFHERSRRLVTAMNGTIRFRSGEASGFVAELELPEAAGAHALGMLSENSHAGNVRTNHEATVAGRR